MKKLKNKVDLYTLFMYSYFLIVLFYVYHTSFISIIPHSQIITLFMVLMSFTLLMIANYKYINFDNKKVVICFLIFAFLILFRNGEIRNGHFLSVGYYLFILSSAYVLSCNDKWHKIAINCLTFYVIQHILATFFCYIFSDFYYNHILGLFPKFRSELLWQYNHHQISGITNHYSKNALYLVSGLLITFPPLIKKDTANKKIYCIFLIFNLLALLLVGKRSQIVYVLLCYLIVLIFINRHRIKDLVIKLTCISIISIVSLFLISKFVPSITSSFDRGYKTLTSKNFLGENRTNLYNLAIDEFKEHPLIGIGWDEYKYEYYVKIENKERERMTTHNIYLQTLCETGIIGSIFIYSLLILLFIMPFKDLRKSNDFEYEIYMFICFHIFFILEGIFGNSLYDLQTYTPYFIVLAMYINRHLEIKSHNY